MQGKRVVLAISGSIAAYKALVLLRLMREAGIHITPIMTANAQHFVTPVSVSALAGAPAITSLFHEGAQGHIAHISTAHETDAIVVAPASANLIAKLALGLADDAVTTTCLASTCLKIIAPAMETGMWQNPITQRHITTLRHDGWIVVEPQKGALASGHTGIGRMAEPQAIFQTLQTMHQPGDLYGEHLLITAGPTREALDPARFLSNPSTGIMGIALAQQALARGAAVTLVLGPTSHPVPHGAQVVRVTTARDMLAACESHLSHASMVLMAAAPADYRPAQSHAHKIKKNDPQAAVIQLEPNPDILKTLRARTPHRIVVGFAAETHNLEAHAQDKLHAKDLDIIVANPIGTPDAGFESITNRVILIFRDGRTSALPSMHKTDVANAILDATLALRKARSVHVP